MRAKAVQTCLVVILLLISIGSAAAQNDYEFRGIVGPSTAGDLGGGYKGFIGISPLPGPVSNSLYVFYPWAFLPPILFVPGAGPELTPNPPEGIINTLEPEITMNVIATCADSCNLFQGCDGEACFDWYVDGVKQDQQTITPIQGTDKSYSSTFTFSGAQGEHKVQVIVTDPSNKGQSLAKWTVNVLGTIPGKSLQIRVYQGEIKETGDGENLETDAEISLDPEISPSASSDSNFIYAWDFGKRDNPWGRKTQQNTCRKADGNDECARNFLALGDTKTSSGNPCICLDGEMPTFGDYALPPEYYIYPDSVQFNDGADGENNLPQRVTYDSVIECEGWTSEEVDQIKPLYKDAPEDKPEACQVSLIVFKSKEEQLTLKDTIWFNLKQGVNKPPVIRFNVAGESYAPGSQVAGANEVEVTAGTSVTFDASLTEDPDGPDESISYLWEFGNGATSSSETASYSYPVVGDYPIKLTAWDISGASSLAEGFTVRVVPGLTAEILPESVSASQLVPEPIQYSGRKENTIDLGSQVEFRATAKSPRTVTRFIWDLGKRDKPWGEIKQRGSEPPVCEKRDNSAARCSLFQALNGKRDSGTPCVCNKDPLTEESLITYPYPEYNIYSESLEIDEVGKQGLVESRVVSSYLSEAECEDYGSPADKECDISVTVETESDGVLSYSSLDVTDASGQKVLPKTIELYGIPGDLIVDGRLDKCDRDLLYRLVTGGITEEEVDGESDVNGDGAVDIKDYVELYDEVKGEPDCASGSAGAESEESTSGGEGSEQ